MSTTKITKAAVGLAVVAAFALTGCSQHGADAPTATTSTQAPAPATTPVAVQTPTPEATQTPAADQFSQVVGGVLFQGTDKAPVRIGTDTPGQAPAADATAPAYAPGESLGAIGDVAQAAGKYLVWVGATKDSAGNAQGFGWAIYGTNSYGTFRGLANQGGSTGTPYPTLAAAEAGPFVLDGRTLDRAEYILRTQD